MKKQTKKKTGPRILIYDIETAPIVSYTWGLFDQNVGLSQIKTDWHLLSWAAKWLDDPPGKMMFADQRNVKNLEDDKAILQKLWHLLDSADIVITQNGMSFDNKKVNARFAFHGMKPPSTYKNIDTKRIASRYFAFTSNKLEYLTHHLGTKTKKLKPKKFAGFALWKACLAGDKQAWKEMELYNKADVLSLEDLYKKLIPWDSSINFSVYHEEKDYVCSCGSTSYHKNGYGYTSSGKFQRYVCNECGKESRSKVNLMAKEKRKTLHTGVKRS